MAEMTVREIVELAAEIATQKTKEYIEQDHKRQVKAKRDWRLRNTKLLLKNYRSFILHCEDIKLEIDKLDAETLADLDSMDFAVESIKRSKQKTVVIVNFIQQMMLVYRIVCERSSEPEDMRRYRTVEMMYISNEKLHPKEIAERQNIDPRTVYKDINKACEVLSTLMFGVDGVRLVD